MQRTIFITGATSGIGKASAQHFGRKGYRVFASYRNNIDAQVLEQWPGVQPIRMDVTNPEDIRNAFEQVSDEVRGRGLYALLNNAGITYTAPFEFADEARARAVMEVNVMAPYKITQTFLPLLKEYNSRNAVKSRVVHTGSWAEVMAQPFIPFYNASKFALAGLTESMYYDLGLLGIHVVLASPGVTKTPLLEKATADGVNNLIQFSEQGKQFYKPYFDHYSTMSKSSRDSSFFPTPEKIAEKLWKIVDAKRPRFKYNMALDAMLVGNVLTKFLPFRWRAAINRRMFKLNK